MLDFSWLSFGFAVLNFIILAALLWRFLHKPLLNALEKRETDIETARKQASDETLKAEEVRKQYEDKLASAATERDELLAEARRATEAAREKLIADATADARRQAENLARAAERERNESVAKLQELVADTAVSVAGSVLARVSDADIEERLEAMLLKELSSIDGDALKGADQCPVRVTSANDLNTASRNAITTAIADAAGAEPTLEFKTDQALLAGTRVEFNAFAVDTSLLDVLARVREGIPADAEGNTQ